MQNKSHRNIVTNIVLVIAVCVLGYAGYHLYGILHQYKKASDEYSEIRSKYTEPEDASDAENGKPNEDGTWPLTEDAEPPIAPDWDALKKENSDIVGWVYAEAAGISYPVVRSSDDNYYLHRSFHKEYLYAGCIFEESECSPYFDDPHTLVYGHNMKNGSMFAMLKVYLNQDTYDSNPYFWILTPNGNYRYHIFSAFITDPKSAVYKIFQGYPDEFAGWEQELKKASAVTNTVPFGGDGDHIVTLSTCNNHTRRTVVIGRCVSSKQPEKPNETH